MKFKTSGLRTRTTLVAATAYALFALLAANVGALSLDQTETSVRQQQVAALRAVVANTHRSIRQGWVEPLRADLTNMVSSNAFRSAVAELSAHSGIEQRDHHVTHTHAAIDRGLQLFASGHAVESFFVVTPDGKIIHPHPNDHDAHGTPLPIHQTERAAWERALDGRTELVSALSRNDETGAVQHELHLLAPVRGAGDRTTALVVVRVDPIPALRQVTQIGRLGASGETYAFNADGLMLTDTRFADDLTALGLGTKDGKSAFSLTISDPGVNLYESPTASPAPHRALTHAVREAQRAHEGASSTAYRDYRGVPVLGAWEWDEDLQFGLVTEIDEVEALAPYREMRNTMVGSLTTLLALTGMLMWLVRRLELRMLESLHEKEQEQAAYRVALETRFQEQNETLIREEKRIKTILDKLTDGVISIDANGIITAFSAAASEIFGYAPAEVIGKNIDMLMPAETAREHGGYISRYLKTGEPRILRRPREVVGRRKNGGGFPMELAVGEARFGEEVFFTGIIRDLSRREETERRVGQLRRHIDYLRDELRRAGAPDDTPVDDTETGPLETASPAVAPANGNGRTENDGANVSPQDAVHDAQREPRDAYDIATSEQRAVGGKKR